MQVLALARAQLLYLNYVTYDCQEEIRLAMQFTRLQFLVPFSEYMRDVCMSNSS